MPVKRLILQGMDDSEASAGPEFSAEERELIKDLVFEGQSLDTHDLKSWLCDKGLSGRVGGEVERLLLAAASCADDFLERPAADLYLGASRELPARIGRYPVIEEIGSGGMGVVYAALDEELNRRVAIKVLLPRSADDPEAQKRLRWDAQAASALQHPNIVTVHEVGFDGRSDYVVMECIAGKTLGLLIPPEGMETTEALGYAIQIASGLEAAHQAGIVHRDLKPGNIMITDTGVVKVLDFGLAKGIGTPFHNSDAPLTIEGKFAGTVAYVSPEQAEGKKDVDVRSDIFSFGSVLFEMLTGRRAFPGDSMISVLADILHIDPPSTTGLHPHIDPRLDEIIQRCMRKDRARRFQSIGEVGVRLREIEEEIQYAKLDRTAARAAIPAKGAKRSWAWLALGIVLGAVATAAVAAMLFFRARTSETLTDGNILLTRATINAGLTDYPTLSQDGKFVAYASDRSGTGNLDIWIQQLKDGELRQLTFGPSNNYEPVYSPDGSRLAFRSDRDGGGIYLISTVGGTERRIADNGQSAQFSPDGQSVAYWTGYVGGSLTPGSAQVYIVPIRSGEPPRQLNFPAAAYPVWSPRGDRLLFLGREGSGDPEWWVASPDGTHARSTHVIEAIFKAGLHRPRGGYWLAPAAWLPSGKVLFSARSGDATNIWSVHVNEDGSASDVPRRLTADTTLDLHPSAIEVNGSLQLAFAALNVSMDIWRVPLDSRGVSTGAPERLISGLDTISAPSITWDGSRVAFASRVPDGMAIQSFGGSKGKPETVATVKSLSASRPVLSGNGEVVAYSNTKNGYLRPISSGQAQLICEHCSLPTHVSFRGLDVLFESLDSGDQLWIWSNRNRQRPLIPWAGKPVLRQFGGRFSPDGKWVVFSGSRFGSSAKHIWITPVRSDGTVGEKDLVSLTDGNSTEIEPYWSPDGQTIYFLSDRDGFQCIWARHVDPATAQPLGAMFAAADFHHARQAIRSPSAYPGDIGLSVSKDSLVLMMADSHGNIWLRPDPSVPGKPR